ncbi:MAG: hypothetical protein JOY81_08780 [Alphaproteobacteria bacterium]|nr:hypothetical protein [Alphaproteobacteria bacterium]
MSRQTLIAIALGSLTLAAAPLATAQAQMGDAVANAEHTCAVHGVGPNTVAFETCVERATAAYEEGQPELAASEAVMVRDSNDVCMSYGLTPQSLGYRQCVGSQLEKRSIASHNISFLPPDEQPHATVAIDNWGFRYDADGNILDQDGYVIRAVP